LALHTLAFRFEKGIKALPLEYASTMPPARVNPRAYIPPPLFQRAVGWHPEWGKVWSGWGTPAYSF